MAQFPPFRHFLCLVEYSKIRISLFPSARLDVPMMIFFPSLEKFTRRGLYVDLHWETGSVLGLSTIEMSVLGSSRGNCPVGKMIARCVSCEIVEMTKSLVPLGLNSS
jgi:hypothetical protein